MVPTTTIIMLPKEFYPYKRVRLSQLFFNHFASGEDTIHWVSNTNEEKADHVEGNNHIHLLKKTKRTGIIGYYLDRFRAIKKFSVSEDIIKNNDIDMIVANDGLVEGFVASRLAKKYNKKFAFYMSSLFFDMDLNEFRTMPSIKSFISMMENLVKVPFLKYLANNSDIFHPISEAMGKEFSNKNTFPLPLCPADSFFEQYEQKDDYCDPFRMIYIGQVTPVRKIDLLIEVLSDVKKAVDIPIELTIVGKLFRKEYRKKILSMIEENDLEDNVHLIDEVPFDEVPSLISSSHLGLCILPPIKAYRVSSPTKVVEYLSLGVPVVANSEIEDQREIIDKSGGGLSPVYERKPISESIIEMINRREELKEIGNKGRLWVKENRNYQILSANLKKLYRDS